VFVYYVFIGVVVRGYGLFKDNSGCNTSAGDVRVQYLIVIYIG